MATVTEERVSAVVISGPREGEVVLLGPEVVSQAPTAEDVESLTMLNKALDTLNATLDRFIAAIRASADNYATAAQRMERE
jgi:hypothetical protein